MKVVCFLKQRNEANRHQDAGKRPDTPQSWGCTLARDFTVFELLDITLL